MRWWAEELVSGQSYAATGSFNNIHDIITINRNNIVSVMIVNNDYYYYWNYYCYKNYCVGMTTTYRMISA